MWGYVESKEISNINISYVHTLFYILLIYMQASLVAQMVKNLPSMQKTWVQSLEKGMATHSNILAWRIPRTEEPGRLQSMGSQRVRRDWRDWARLHTRLFYKDRINRLKPNTCSKIQVLFKMQINPWGKRYFLLFFGVQPVRKIANRLDWIPVLLNSLPRK